MKKTLHSAWQVRQELKLIPSLEALRVFHGPAEGQGAFAQIAIDRFKDYYWITEWAQAVTAQSSLGRFEHELASIQEFLINKGALGAVFLLRPQKGVPEEPKLLFGQIPSEGFTVREQDAHFQIKLLGVRHPGLFLDHLPLRQWLRQNMKGLRVLNTFSYTGSLSVSAGLGGAEFVTTLDLSKPIVQWAQNNWTLNHLAPERARFISGDYFEWLPRLKREGARFDCIILDPPSFSRGKKGTFSTSKDLKKLHALALDVLAPHGLLVTSINSANVPQVKFEAEVIRSVQEKGFSAQVLKRIELPPSFPLAPGERSYLKGLILRISSGKSSTKV